VKMVDKNLDFEEELEEFGGFFERDELLNI
jgi:hypothetical protein